MSVRFNRQGTGVVRDHNELANKGVHTHAEIDQYLNELDEARGTNPSLDTRLDAIEQKNADQDTKDTAQDSAITGLGTRLTASEGDIDTLQSDLSTARSDLSALTTRVTTAEGSISSQGTEITQARGTYPTLKERIDAGATDPALAGRVTDLETEVHTARSTYANLNDRLNAIPTSGGGSPAPGGGGSGTIGVRYWVESGPGTRAGPQTDFIVPTYAVGQHTIMVIVEGVVFSVEEDYVELDPTTIRFNRGIPVDQRVTFIGLSSATGGGFDEQETDTVYVYNSDLTVRSKSIYSIGANPVRLKLTEYVYNAGLAATETVTQNGKTFRKTFFYDAAGNVEKVETRQVI